MPKIQKKIGTTNLCNFFKCIVSSRYGIPNLEDQINTQPDDRRTKNTKKSKTEKNEKYCFEPNMQSNLHLVSTC